MQYESESRVLGLGWCDHNNRFQIENEQLDFGDEMFCVGEYINRVRC